MPQRQSFVRLTDNDAEIVSAATDTNAARAAIKELSTVLTENNRRIRTLKKGPMTAEQFESAAQAAEANVSALEALPAGDVRDSLLSDLREAAKVIGEGVQMHSEGAVS